MAVQSSADAAARCDHFRLDPHPKFDVADLKRLTAQSGEAPGAADGAQLIFWPFDNEDHPFRGASRALG
jgi:hypothetical protein